VSKKQAQEWLLSACADLKSIAHIIEDDFLTHNASFHAQQSVEKCFKALLALHDIPVPRDHSTIRLHHLSLDFINFPIEGDILIDLDALYIESRYPCEQGFLPSGKPTTEDARSFFQLAQRLYDATELRVNALN